MESMRVKYSNGSELAELYVDNSLFCSVEIDIKEKDINIMKFNSVKGKFNRPEKFYKLSFIYEGDIEFQALIDKRGEMIIEKEHEDYQYTLEELLEEGYTEFGLVEDDGEEWDVISKTTFDNDIEKLFDFLILKGFNCELGIEEIETPTDISKTHFKSFIESVYKRFGKNVDVSVNSKYIEVVDNKKKTKILMKNDEEK